MALRPLQTPLDNWPGQKQDVPVCVLNSFYKCQRLDIDRVHEIASGVDVDDVTTSALEFQTVFQMLSDI